MTTFLFLLALFIVGMFLWFYYQVKREEKQVRHNELISIVQRLTKHLKKVNNAKTVKTRVSNAEKAIELLNMASNYKECRDVLSNFDELYRKLPCMIRTLPVADELNKADKNKFKGKDGPEKNNLLNALYEIETNKITDEEFEIALIHDDTTGEIISKKLIEDRLEELGWERPQK